MPSENPRRPKMVAIAFSEFKDKILDGTKTQTIRMYTTEKYEKFRNAKRLQLYWIGDNGEPTLIKDVKLEKVFIIAFDDRFDRFQLYEQKEDHLEYKRCTRPKETEAIVRRDGFSSFKEMKEWFKRHYGSLIYQKFFVVIRWC